MGFKLPDKVNTAISFAVVVLIFVVIIYFGRRYGYEAVDVQYTYMQPTIQAGSYVWVDRNYRKISRLQNGDVICFRRPGKEEMQFGRIVGRPGNIVAYKRGQLMRDGGNAHEGYKRIKADEMEDFSELLVPTHHVLILLDDRTRRGDLGRPKLRDLLIHERNIEGKVKVGR